MVQKQISGRIDDFLSHLQAAVDKKFRSMEEKEEETRRLQVLLRENERDLERQRCVLANNEETIASLEALLRGKALELEQVSNAWRNVQKQQQDVEDQQKRILGERDCIIDQLQAALLARTQEAQVRRQDVRTIPEDLRCSLLPQIHSAPGHVLEELKVRLQLKDHLFQNVMSDRTRQAQEHQEQLQDLLRTISTRDQYIQDSSGRLTEVLNEQSSRVQELRSQLSSGSGSKPVAAPELALEVQALQEELRLALIREKENHEERRNQAGQLDSLSRSLNRQLVDPSDLPLVERLTQEVQELREILVQQDAPRPEGGQPKFGELSCEDEGEADDLKSDIDESVDADESGTQHDDRSGELVADQQHDASSSTRETTVCLQLKSRELQERLMVSEATVQAQAEQLKDYRELLTVQQDSKQIQVDLQDLGYETCGRSENEAEREEASSPGTHEGHWGSTGFQPKCSVSEELFLDFHDTSFQNHSSSTLKHTVEGSRVLKATFLLDMHNIINP
ncbi:hypothetical protein GOODEAATRI_001926 [Goodea atripinnis]|uniref:Myomegalin-like n=1 Tax=Goodea atripinnis TaxID=208336 RepID=A0ABV0MNJ5_9TELE